MARDEKPCCGMNILAEIRTYAQLVEALRRRSAALGLSREALDAAAPLQPGYAGKLLAPVPVRSLGSLTMGPVLMALGVRLLLVEDPETIKRITLRAVRAGDAGDSVLAAPRPKKRRYPKLGSEWGRLMRARQLATQSSVKRRSVAKAGAKARWRKPRVVEVKGKAAM